MQRARRHGRVPCQLLDPGVHVTIDSRIGFQLDEDRERAHRLADAFEHVGEFVENRETLIGRGRRGLRLLVRTIRRQSSGLPERPRAVRVGLRP